MKIKTSFMHLLEHKAGFSKDPVAMVPAPSSLPEFFYSATSLAYPRLVKGTVTSEISGKGVTLPMQTVPVQVLCIVNGENCERIKTFGQN